MIKRVVLLIFTITYAFARQESRIEPRIVNGFDALRSQFPFYVYLIVTYPQKEGVCDGSLISSDVTLTAAHCLQNATRIAVNLGALKARLFSESGRQIINIGSSNFHIH